MKKEAVKKLVVHYEVDGEEKREPLGKDSQIDWDSVSEEVSKWFTINSSRSGSIGVKHYGENK